jgi:hypothetical protein
MTIHPEAYLLPVTVRYFLRSQTLYATPPYANSSDICFTNITLRQTSLVPSRLSVL